MRRATCDGSAISRPSASMAISPAAGSTRARRRTRSMRAAEHRVAAEIAWRDYARDRGAAAARFCGSLAYTGPGRSSFDKLREGTARRIVKAGSGVQSHPCRGYRPRDGACRRKRSSTAPSTSATMSPRRRRIWSNMPRGRWTCQCLPTCRSRRAQMTEMARSFYSDNKRVSSAAIRKALGDRPALSQLSRGARCDLRAARMSAPSAGQGATAAGGTGRPLYPARAAWPAARRTVSMTAAGDARAIPLAARRGRRELQARWPLGWMRRRPRTIRIYLRGGRQGDAARREGRQALMRIVPEHGVDRGRRRLLGTAPGAYAQGHRSTVPPRPLRLRRAGLSPLRVEVQRPQCAEPSGGPPLRLSVRGHLPPAHDRQGRKPRHRMVCDARRATGRRSEPNTSAGSIPAISMRRDRQQAKLRAADRRCRS